MAWLPRRRGVAGVLTLQIESYGETIVKRSLLRFAEDLENPRPGLEAVADLLRHDVEEQFDTEGGHASGGWQALSDKRVEEKARLGLDPRILRASGALMESLTRKFDSRHIERLSGASLTFGSNVLYGVYHQSSLPRTVIPFRPPIALTEEDKREMVKAMQAALAKGNRGAVWGA